MPGTEIKSLVTPVVVRAEASESLMVAARRLWAHEIGALPVFAGVVVLGCAAHTRRGTLPASVNTKRMALCA